MIPNATYKDEKVILRYFQPIPKLIKVGSKQYYFDCQHGVSLAFVDEKEAPILLEVLGGCCGGKKKVITLASEGIYKYWLSGDR